MKKIGLYQTEIFVDIKKYFAGKDVEISEISDIDEVSDFDLVITYNCKNLNSEKVIDIFPALLPAFKDSENALIEAFNYGVKVSGITVHKDDKILAQYPALIGADTHFDEFENEMLTVQKKLVPVVADCILNDRVFDFQDLFKSPCAKSGSGCAGCGGCH